MGFPQAHMHGRNNVKKPLKSEMQTQPLRGILAVGPAAIVDI